MSKPADTWMPLYIGDYLADTMHLTHTQHGIYILLIMAYWRTGGPLSDQTDQLAAVTKCSAAEWRKHRPVIAKFFHVEDGQWVHKRIDAELEAASKITQERSKAGANGAAKRWQTHSNEMAKPSQIDAPSPSPSPKGSVATSEPTSKNLTSEPFAARATDENQGFLRKFEEVQGGRSAPLEAAISRNKRDHLVQKLIRYSQATLAEPQLSAAVDGLCGADPNHNDQWWLDHLDKKMRDEHWDDTERISA